MSRYPRAARSASVKCIDCNAPTTRVVEGDYVCVSCGETLIAAPSEWPPLAEQSLEAGVE